jgi:phosphoribosylanthranilate isomerase
VRVKVCGNTAIETAMAAVEAGADMVGFIMAPGTPRTVTVEQAREIVRRLPATVDTVGVFVDRPVAEVAQVAAEAGFTVVQLHGRETWAEFAELPYPTIKALRLEDASTAASIDWPPMGLVLADTHAAGMLGGTGQTFPWQWVADLAMRHRLVVSGGLSSENVGAAVVALQPWGVDASSRLESSPGVKDADLVRAFVAAARRAEEEVMAVA